MFFANLSINQSPPLLSLLPSSAKAKPQLRWAKQYYHKSKTCKSTATLPQILCNPASNPLQPCLKSSATSFIVSEFWLLPNLKLLEARGLLKGVWRVSWGCLEDVLMVSRRCLLGVWMVFGRFLEGMCSVSAGFLEGVWTNGKITMTTTKATITTPKTTITTTTTTTTRAR